MRRISFGARTYNASIGRFDGVDELAEKYFAWSPYHYTFNNPLDNIDPDGRSIWTKVAKAVVKVGKVVAKEGVSSLKKGATWADAVSDIVDNGKTVLDDKAGTTDRVVAGLSLLSEALPVSVGDIKDVYKGGKKLLGAVDGAKDITKRPSSFRKKTVEDNWKRASDGSKPNTKKCPTCDKDVEGNPNNGERRDGKNGWDVSHNPSWSKRKMPLGATRKDALDEYNRGTELECRNCNRSRGNKDEKKSKKSKSMNMIEHIETYLGEITTSFLLKNDKISIQALEFQNTPFPDVTTYLTLGVSKFDLHRNPDYKFKQEYLFAAHKSFDRSEIASMLLTFSESIIEKGIALLRGEVIGEKPLISNVRANSLYVSMPAFWEDDFYTFNGSTPPTIFVWLMPIMSEEYHFVKSNGWNDFEDKLEMVECDFWDLNRKPIFNGLAEG